MLWTRNRIATISLGILSLTIVSTGCGNNKVRHDKVTQSSAEEAKDSRAPKPDTADQGKGDGLKGQPNSSAATSKIQTQEKQSGSDAKTIASSVAPSSTSQTSSSTQASSKVVEKKPLPPAQFVDMKGRTLGENDLSSIKSCLAQFKAHPFVDGKTFKVKTIEMAVSALGLNFGGTDSATSEPQLVLVNSGFNTSLLGGTPTLNLRNPNGFYCMKPQFNFDTELIINLDCKAQLASSKNQFPVIKQITDVAGGGLGIPFASEILGANEGFSFDSAVEVNRSCQ